MVNELTPPPTGPDIEHEPRPTLKDLPGLLVAAIVMLTAFAGVLLLGVVGVVKLCVEGTLRRSKGDTEPD